MPSLPQLAVAVGVLVVAGLFWVLGGRRLRQAAANRLLYGLPLGTIVVVGVLVTVYLFLQDGLTHWSDPLVFPFVSWSYQYPAGVLTAGFTHSSPSHIVSNLTGLVAFGVLVEYAWGHYRRPEETGNWPWVRALLVFPALLLGAGFVTAAVGLGPGLGFSGAVFALLGAAVVTLPGPAVLAVLAASVLSTVVSFIQEPIVEGTVTAAPPTPPGWAGVGFHAHAVGFLLGVLFGLWLLTRDLPRPSIASVAAGTFVVGVVQGLWLIVLTPARSTFVRYDAVGFVVLVGVAMLVGVAVGGSTARFEPILGSRRWLPSRRGLAWGWGVFVVVGGIAIGAAGVLESTVPLGTMLLFVGAGVAAWVLPAVAVLLPGRGPLSRRRLATVVLAMGLILLAAPGIYSGGANIVDTGLEDRSTLDVNDYQVVYGTDLTVTRGNLFDGPGEAFNTSDTAAVAVTSQQRQLWTLGVRSVRLAAEPTQTIVVGGVGWREDVSVTRSSWGVVGNETVYAVDLAGDDQCVRSFTSPPATAGHTLGDRQVAVAPTDTGFEVQLTTTDGQVIDTTPVPPVNETTTVDTLSVTTVDHGNTHVIEVSTADTTVTIADRPADAPTGCV